MFTLLLLLLPLIISTSKTKGDPERRLLEGLKINCCVIRQYPSVYPDPERKPFGLNGLGIDYLYLLQDRLGFECNDLPQLVSSEESFNGMVDQMEGCTNRTLPASEPICNCQLGVGSWVQTAERFGRVDFLQNFMREELEVLVHVENTDSSIRGAYFLTTFTSAVWALIVGLFVIFTSLKMLDKRFAPPESPYVPLDPCEPPYRRFKYYILKSRFLFRLRKATQSTLTRMVSGVGDGDDTPGSSRQWALNFAILLCSVFVALTYGRTMTASLVQEGITSDYRTIFDFRNCHVPPSEVCMPQGGIAEGIWRHAIQGRRNCHNGTFPSLIKTFDETITEVVQKRCKFAIVDSSTAGDATTRRYCRRLLITGEKLYWGGGSFILPFGSNLTSILSEATLRLHDAGQIDTLDEFFAMRDKCPNVNLTKLDMVKLKFFFILSYSGCFILLIFMIFEPQTPHGRRISELGTKGVPPPAAHEDSNEEERL